MIVLCIFIIFGCLFSINAYLVKEIPISIQIGPYVGLDVNGTALTFGKVPRGSTSVKKIIISNLKDYEVKVVFKAYGETEQFIKYEDNGIILKPYEAKEVSIFATAPLNSEYKEYIGVLKVYALKTWAKKTFYLHWY